MEVFDLTRGTTTGTVRVPAKAGETAQFKIRSTKAKKVNGKSQTPERINFTYHYANQAVVRASWKEDPSNAELYIVTLLVIYTNTANTENNTTVPFTQNESGNVLNLTGVDETSISTIGGSSGKWFGTINVSFTYGSISGSNDIELYQR